MLVFMSQIFQYRDYREFLRHHVSMCKQENPEWTIAGWARELGLLATTSLTKILNGQREPGEKICQKLLEYFRFNDEEAKYFVYLIRLNKTSDSGLREVFEEKLSKLAPSQGKLQLDEAKFQVVAEWTHFAIRQMAQVMPLPYDAKLISSQLLFDVSVEQVAAAIKNLLQLGLITLKDGFLYKTDSWIATTDDIPSKALRQHHTQMIKNAVRSIEEIPVQQREIRGMTMAVPTNKMPVAKNLIRQFTEDMARLMSDGSLDQVYQLNVQFFPLSKNKSQENQA